MHLFVLTISFAEACKIRLGQTQKIYGVMGLEILLLQSYDRFVQTEVIQYVP